jgi:hypothetical protein
LSAYLKSHPEPYINATTGEPVLFMHGLTASGGEQRLVVVTLSPTINPTQFYFSASSTPSGDNFHSPSDCLDLIVRSDDRLRLSAGSLDPNDPSHFTIPYTLNGAAGVLDGYLTASYTIAITPRSTVTTHGYYEIPVWNPTSAPIPDVLRPNSDAPEP